MTVNEFYKQKFGRKVYKISLDAGCTCPNRDGTKSYSGCIFCGQNGSGDFIPFQENIRLQVENAKKIVEKKIKNGKYIAYFQNFTNTYGDIEILYKKWNQALSCEDIAGIAIGTRPDCIDSKVLEKLSILSEKTFVQLELGLQSSSDKTGFFINRQFFSSEYLKAVSILKKNVPRVHVVTHIIFGLPFEDEKQMLSSVKFAIDAKTDGIKIASLYVLKNTVLEKMYLEKKFSLLSREKYFSIVEKALKIIPENVVIHRLTGDGPKSQTIAPLWIFDKKQNLSIINEILKNK